MLRISVSGSAARPEQASTVTNPTKTTIFRRPVFSTLVAFEVSRRLHAIGKLIFLADSFF
jgi:hypothetical protein